MFYESDKNLLKLFVGLEIIVVLNLLIVNTEQKSKEIK